MKTFREIRFLDLHGNSKKKEKNPDGSTDENVFDIQQGVAVVLAYVAKHQQKSVFHADLWGTRMAKYAHLAEASVTSTEFAKLTPTAPFYLFIPQNTDLRSEFEPLPSVTEIFPINSMGVTTGDDDRFVGFSEDDIDGSLRSREKISQFSYRPFDTRFVYYHADKLARARLDFMRHMIEHRNVALVTIRRPRNDKIANFFVSNGLTDSGAARRPARPPGDPRVITPARWSSAPSGRGPGPCAAPRWCPRKW